jgi:hypothetical protein
LITCVVCLYRIENQRKKNTTRKKTINARHTRSIQYSNGGRRTMCTIIIILYSYIIIWSLSSLSLTALSSLRPAGHTYAHASPPMMRAAKDEGQCPTPGTRRITFYVLYTFLTATARRLYFYNILLYTSSLCLRVRAYTDRHDVHRAVCLEMMASTFVRANTFWNFCSRVRALSKSNYRYARR